MMGTAPVVRSGGGRSGPSASRGDGRGSSGGGLPSSTGRPFSISISMRRIVSAFQSIYCVTIIVQTDETILSMLYSPFQKARTAEESQARRSATAQSQATSITSNGAQNEQRARRARMYQ